MKLPNRYQATGESERGGLGDVVFCKDKALDREVAIKTIRDHSEINRIRDEITALLLMRSKHVVQVFDVINFENDNLGIVLEFVAGEDLLVSSVPQKSPENYLNILWQISSGISDIHDANIIHRDIKPNNMKLDNEGILKIFDFGLSRKSKEDAETIGFKGTFGFAAPELFSHDKVDFTKAIDVYAFGVLTYYLVSKSLPSELNVRPPEIIVPGTYSNTFLAGYPALEPIFESCLSYNPVDRPNMSFVRDEIKRHLLKGRHQALAVLNGKNFLLSSEKERANFTIASIGTFSIIYDGLRFHIDNVSGEIYMNNIEVTEKKELIGSCVVAIGSPERENSRSYITFDVSNPEVAL